MKWFIMLLTVLSGIAFTSSPALAQRDAGSKARGDIYSFYGSSTYTRHARDHARLLYQFGQTREAIPKETVQQHVAEVRRNVDAAKKELAKLKKAKSDDKNVQKHIAVVENHFAKCEEMCKMADAAGAKDKPDAKAISDCCATMSRELDAAHAEHEKLMKTLGVEKFQEPKTDAAK